MEIKKHIVGYLPEKSLYLPKEDYRALKCCREVESSMSIPFTRRSFSKVADDTQAILSSLEGIGSANSWKENKILETGVSCYTYIMS